jgi:hypothetical protein
MLYACRNRFVQQQRARSTSHARRFVARKGTARRARGPPMRYRDKPEPMPKKGPFWMPIPGPDYVPFDMLQVRVAPVG